MSEYSTQMHHWFEEVWNKGNEDAIPELLDENAVIHGLEIDPALKGPTAFRPFYSKFREAFPKVEVKLDHLIKTNDYEAAYCFVTATADNGKTVKFNGIAIARYENGKLIEAWNAFDFLSMYTQLGLKLVAEGEVPDKKEEEGYVVMESGLGINE